MLIKLLGVVLGGLDTYFFIWWVRELTFYSGKNWDFTNEFGLKLYFGGEGGLTRQMTPKQKLVFGYPLFIFVLSISFVAVAAIMLRE